MLSAFNPRWGDDSRKLLETSRRPLAKYLALHAEATCRLEVAGQELRVGELLGATWGLKNRSGEPLDTSWRPTELSWRLLESLGGVLGALGSVLEASWEVLGRSWRRIRGVLEAPWVVLEPS